jgi:hypothetical protein
MRPTDKDEVELRGISAISHAETTLGVDFAAAVRVDLWVESQKFC